jgi:aspartate aminotransferase
VAMNARNFDVKVLECHSAGFESYRSKLAQFYTNQGLPINVEDIIITTGGSVCFCNGSTMDPEMKSSQNHFTQITMVFCI